MCDVSLSAKFKAVILRRKPLNVLHVSAARTLERFYAFLEISLPATWNSKTSHIASFLHLWANFSASASAARHSSCLAYCSRDSQSAYPPSTISTAAKATIMGTLDSVGWVAKIWLLKSMAVCARITLAMSSFLR